MEIFSFFSGIGFLDLGFETAGADISFVNEKVAKSAKFRVKKLQKMTDFGNVTNHV